VCIIIIIFISVLSQGKQSSMTQCLSKARINWEGCGRHSIRHKGDSE